jgi:hypothetical protein
MEVRELVVLELVVLELEVLELDVLDMDVPDLDILELDVLELDVAECAIRLPRELIVSSLMEKDMCGGSACRFPRVGAMAMTNSRPPLDPLLLFGVPPLFAVARCRLFKNVCVRKNFFVLICASILDTVWVNSNMSATAPSW